MEQQYNQQIYQIIGLIRDKKYKRAITILEHIVDQGIRTNQIILLLSYAHRSLFGASFGLQYLRKHSDCQSPMIKMAEAQYSAQVQNYQKTLQYLKINASQQSIIGQLAHNYENFIYFNHEQPINQNSKLLQYTRKQDEEKFIALLNTITKQYKQIKNKNQLSIFKKNQLYKDILKHYESIQVPQSCKHGKVSLLLSKYIKYMHHIIVTNKKYESF